MKCVTRVLEVVRTYSDFLLIEGLLGFVAQFLAPVKSSYDLSCPGGEIDKSFIATIFGYFDGDILILVSYIGQLFK